MSTIDVQEVIGDYQKKHLSDKKHVQAQTHRLKLEKEKNCVWTKKETYAKKENFGTMNLEEMYTILKSSDLPKTNVKIIEGQVIGLASCKFEIPLPRIENYQRHSSQQNRLALESFVENSFRFKSDRNVKANVTLNWNVFQANFETTATLSGNVLFSHYDENNQYGRSQQNISEIVQAYRSEYGANFFDHYNDVEICGKYLKRPVKGCIEHPFNFEWNVQIINA